MPTSATTPCGHCGSERTVRNGSSRGHPQWTCRTCGRSFRATTGTPLAHLKTPVGEVAQALLIVLRRGSLRATEAITDHKYETVGAWLRRAGEHVEALTETLVHDRHLPAGEVDECWSFVATKGAHLRPRAVPPRPLPWTAARPIPPPLPRTDRPGANGGGG